MSETQVKITKKTVDAAQPREKLYRIWDTELKGLGLRITPAGAKSYIIRYRPGGGRAAEVKEYTIGKHGPITPEIARRSALTMLGEIAMGHDPQKRRQDGRSEMSMSDFCDMYIEQGMRMKKESTRISDTYRINAHIRPLLGKKKISAIDAMDIESFVQDVATGAHTKRKPSKVDNKKSGATTETRKRTETNAKGGKGTSTRTMILLSAMFSWAIYPAKLLKENPCKGVKKFAPKASLRHLSMDELKKVGEAMDAPDLNKKAAAIIRLLVLTGARKSEIQCLKRSEVDLNLGFLKLEDSKTGQKIIPLGVSAVNILSEFMEDQSSPYVFPSDNPEIKGPFVGVPKVWGKIRNAAGISDVRLHDLRHTFASVGLVGGDSLAVIGAILGHKDPKTTARYAHLASSPVRDAARRVDNKVAAGLRIKPKRKP